MQETDSRTRDLLALTFASFFPLLSAILYFVVFDDPDGMVNRVIYTTSKVVQFGFPILFVWWFDRARIAWTLPSWNGIPLAAGFGLLVAVAMFALYFTWLKDVPALRDDAPQKIVVKLRQSGLTTPGRYLAFCVFLTIAHSLAEEYYWRWFVFGWLRRHVSTNVAIVLSGIGFMLHHVVIVGVFFAENFWTLAVPLSLCVGIGGGVWAWIYARSDSIYAPWLSHAIIDAAILGLGYVMLESYW